MFDNAKNPLILQTKFEDFQRYTHEALFQFPKKRAFSPLRADSDGDG